MSPRAEVVVRLSRHLAECAAEAAVLDALAAEVADAARRGPDEVDRAHAALLALALHDYYTCVETIFERVATAVDEARPSGVSSLHAHLQHATQLRDRAASGGDVPTGDGA